MRKKISKPNQSAGPTAEESLPVSRLFSRRIRKNTHGLQMKEGGTIENSLMQSRNNKLDYILSQHKIPYPECYDVNCELKDPKDLQDGTRYIRLTR